MRILYIAPYTSVAFLEAHGDRGAPGFGGLRKTELMCEALSRAGHQVVLLSSAMLSVSRWRVRPAREEWLDRGGNPVRVIYPAALELRPLGGLVSALRARRVADRVLGEFQADIVLAYNTHLFEFLATTGLVASARVPVYVEVEDLPLARRREWASIKPRLDQRCWGPMMARASGFTAVNESILRMLPPGKPARLLPGIVDDQLRVEAGRRAGAFTGGRRTLGYFGGLTEEKGVGILLEILPMLPEPWDIVVTGGGPLAARFEAAEARHPGRMRFLGVTPSPEELYRRMCSCDCTFVPPERIGGDGEGVFPFKLFEYLVAKTHVIAPRLKPLEGSALHFVQRWDGRLDSLAGLLLRAEGDYRQETLARERASETIVGQYSIEGVGELMTSLFRGSCRPSLVDDTDPSARSDQRHET